MIRLSATSFSVLALAAVAVAGPNRAPKTYDLKNVEWHVTLQPDKGTIVGDVTNSIHLLKAEDSVDFDSGPLSIDSVTVNGTAATVSFIGETLTVNLPDKGAKGDYKVEIKYHGKPTAGIYFVPARTAYPAHTPVVYTQGEAEDTRYWLPTYDYPDNKATSEGFITVPKGWDVLSNGKLIEKKAEGDLQTIHWKMDKPMSTYLISLVAGPYEVGHEKWGTMPVEYWVPEGLLDWGKAAFGGTGKIIDVYSKLTGFKYPYVKFAQSAVPDFMFGGMENITAVTQTISAIFPPSVASTNDSTGLVAHELAHQWFGDTVTCEDWSHAWLNEGFATFMPPFYTRATQGDEAFEAERAGIFSGAANGGSLPLVWTGYKIPMENFFQNVIYPGGATRMYMLMYKLGEKAFWSGIHDYLETYKYKPVTTEDFFSSMSKSTGVDLDTFRTQWFYTKGIPHVSVKSEGGTITVSQSKPYFDIDPAIWIWDAKAGDFVKKTVHLTSTIGEAKLEVGEALASAPIQIEPEGHFLVVSSAPNATPADQRAAMFDRLPGFARSRFVRTLGSLDQKSILKLLDEPKNKFYQDQLIRDLDKSSKDVLIAYATGTDAHARQAAEGRLFTLYGKEAPEDVKSVISKMAESDPNTEIRSEAYGHMVQITGDVALVEKAWTMDSFRDAYRTMALGWWNQHDKAAAKKHALEALDTPLSEPVQLQAISILGQMKDEKGETVIYDHLIAIFKGTSYAERISAMYALVNYGNKDALKVIEPLTHESLFFTRQAAEGAYSALKNGGNGGGFGD